MSRAVSGPIAHRPDMEEAAPQHPARGVLRRSTPPGLWYRLASWRPPAAVGRGALAVDGRGPGVVRLSYQGPHAGREHCLHRQRWALRVPPSCGAVGATLEETACLARGDDACRYVVSWCDRARPASALAVGVVLATALVALRLPAGARTAWALVPLLTAAAWGVERWRVGRGAPRARREAAAAFRASLLPALAEEDTPAPAPAADGDRPDLSLEREDHDWRIEYQGTVMRLRHSRGLALLAHLVRNPGREIHVAELDAMTPSGASSVPRAAAAPRGGVPPAPGDAGEVLDAQARGEYRRRIGELRGDLADAEARNDLGRAEVARAELELLEDELRASVGPGGRPRRAASDAERLRVAITHRIRKAIVQIEQRHPVLGAHLAASVSTGYRCVYEPAAAAGPVAPSRERKA